MIVAATVIMPVCPGRPLPVSGIPPLALTINGNPLTIGGAYYTIGQANG